MRKPQLHFISYPNTGPKAAQQGFSLFIVLMVMIVVAFFVVSVTQSYNTEQRISTNDADHKYALALAEVALRDGEKSIAAFGNVVTFKPDCENALCSAADAKPGVFVRNRVEAAASNKEAWERGCGSKLCIEEKGKKVEIKGAREHPRYIIEHISTQEEDGSSIYRVTAKAWGQNKNTVVILQSYVQG